MIQACKFLLTVILSLIFISGCQFQSPEISTHDNKEILHSEILNEPRNLLIHLPAGYEQSDRDSSPEISFYSWLSRSEPSWLLVRTRGMNTTLTQGLLIPHLPQNVKPGPAGRWARSTPLWCLSTDKTPQTEQIAPKKIIGSITDNSLFKSWTSSEYKTYSRITPPLFS